MPTMKKTTITKERISTVVADALAEDIGGGDVTAQYTIAMDARTTAVCTAKETTVVCGMSYAKEAFAQVDPRVRFVAHAKDGAVVEKNTKLFTVKGPARGIVSAERTAINFLGMMSGIATTSRRLQAMVAPYGVTLLDTRKTTPNLRHEEKYAVATGGASNHRMGLYDMFLLKENHLFAAGIKTAEAIDAVALWETVRRMKTETGLKIEVEVENLRELSAALTCGCDVVMLDNFTPAAAKKAVVLRNALSPDVKLEASGGITEKSLISFAHTRLDFISMGALTHAARCADLSLRMDPIR
jgi:nicotinate-nucleotide pyrophosphorylase (carboxylating)